MKKILCLLLVLLFTLSLVACSDGDGTPEGMQNVSTENALFNLYVPASWIPTTAGGVSGAHYSSSDASNVTVTTYLPEGEMSAADYWTNVCLPSYRDGGVLQNFAIVEASCKDTTLGGKDAKQYVFTYTLDGETYEVMQIIAAGGDMMLYTMTYSALSTKYAEHLEDVERIRAEFKFR